MRPISTSLQGGSVALRVFATPVVLIAATATVLLRADRQSGRAQITAAVERQSQATGEVARSLDDAAAGTEDVTPPARYGLRHDPHSFRSAYQLGRLIQVAPGAVSELVHGRPCCGLRRGAGQ